MIVLRLRTLLQSPRAQRVIRIIALALPVSMLLLGTGWVEREQYVQVRANVAGDARVVASDYAALIAKRLRMQFTELQFIALALLGPQADPSRPAPDVVLKVQRFMALHPSLYAFNIQSADGKAILWSTQHQSDQPITPGGQFTPLPDQPDLLLGQDRWAARVHASVLTMRYRVRGSQGHTRFFVGSPYRIEELLGMSAGSAKKRYLSIALQDLRDGSVVGVWDQGHIRFPSSLPEAARLSIAVPGLPLQVRVYWPAGLAGRQYRRNAPVRWVFEVVSFFLLLLASWRIAILLERHLASARASLRLAHEAQEATQFSETLFDNIGGVAMVLDANGCIVRLNARAERFVGYTTAEVRGKPYFWTRFIPEEERPEVQDIFKAMRERALPHEATNHWVSRSGQRRLFNWINSVMEDESGQPAYLVTIGTDITEKQRLSRHNAQLLISNQILAQINQTLALADDEHAVLKAICDLAVRIPRVQLAWIGCPDASGRFEVLASAGDTNDYLASIDFSIDASIPEGQGPVGRVWREQSPLFSLGAHSQGVADPPGSANVPDEHIEMAAVLPILHGGRMWGEFVLYASQGEVLEYELQELLIELSFDVSRGLDLLASRQRLKLLERSVSALSEGLTIADAGRRLTYVNPAFSAMTGYPAEEVLGRNCNFIQDGRTDVRTVDRIREALVKGERFDGEILNTKKDGSPFWNQLHLDAVRDARGQITHYIGVQRDVTVLVQQRRAYRDLQGLYHALLQTADVVLRTDNEAAMLFETCAQLAEGTLFHASWIGKPAANGVFQILAKAGEGVTWVDSVPVPLNHERSLMAEAWRAGHTVYKNDYCAHVGEGTLQEAALRHRWMAALATVIKRSGQPWAVLVMAAPERDVFHDASVKLCERVAALLGQGLDALDRKEALHTLQALESQRARTDELTSLPNRRALDEVLPGAIARAHRQQSAFALGIIDLDDFKPVNDTFGHPAGDLLLQQFTRRLRGQLRGADFLARLGGDEFVLLLEFLDPDRIMDQLVIALRRVHTTVETAFDLGEGRIAKIEMSMGLALYPRDAKEPDVLMRLADAALYQVKAHKNQRSEWWGVEAQPMELPAPAESLFDPYSVKAAELLRSIEEDRLKGVADHFDAAFDDNLRRQPHLERIIRGLSAQKLQRLRQSLTSHLLDLLNPQRSRASIEERALHLGRIHALVGLPLEDLERMYALFEDLLRQHLEATPLFSSKRYEMMRVAAARLRLDVQTQMGAISKTTGAYFAVLRTPAVEHVGWPEAILHELSSLVGLPGIRHAGLFRPDHDGRLRIEALAGVDSERLQQAIDLDAPYLRLDPQLGLGCGPLSKAWFSREIHVVEADQSDPPHEHWRELARELGWRCAVALPLANLQEVDSVLLLTGAYPNQFSSDWVHSWLDLLRTRFEAILSSQIRGDGTPDLAYARTVRESLYGKGLRMWVQPIVDLRNGAIPKVEALARLHLDDGTVLVPGQFLNELGSHDLNVLFRRGLHQALELVSEWHTQGIEVDIAVNLPPSTLLHPDCPLWVEQALCSAQVASHRLSLEILESEALDALRSGEAIHALNTMGVRLSLDDLGSGYNSLSRLADLPFDTVKIDQALVRKLSSDPIRTVRLLSALLSIGKDFAHNTVVEGLEDEGAVEAAQWIRAPLGQGFGLARPMPAEAFPAWLRGRMDAPPIRSAELHTWAGALAYLWASSKGGQKAVLQDLAHCPLLHFLRAEGVTETRVFHWHGVLHSNAERNERKVASDALLQWLADQVIRFGMLAQDR